MIKKVRKPRSYKSDFSRMNDDMCPHCKSFGCDPSCDTKEWRKKKDKRYENKQCVSCGNNPCVCKSSDSNYYPEDMKTTKFSGTITEIKKVEKYFPDTHFQSQVIIRNVVSENGKFYPVLRCAASREIIRYFNNGGSKVNFEGYIAKFKVDICAKSIVKQAENFEHKLGSNEDSKLKIDNLINEVLSTLPSFKEEKGSFQNIRKNREMIAPFVKDTLGDLSLVVSSRNETLYLICKYKENNNLNFEHKVFLNSLIKYLH